MHQSALPAVHYLVHTCLKDQDVLAFEVSWYPIQSNQANRRILVILEYSKLDINELRLPSSFPPR